jgi:uncharacterized protein
VDFVANIAVPHLESRGVPVFAIVPESRSLAALTVRELIDVLQAEVLTEETDLDALVENLTVGAMTAEAALSRFRKQTHKAVITGGDRTDIQLAALETSTACLVLTGNLRPSPLIIKQAQENGVDRHAGAFQYDGNHRDDRPHLWEDPLGPVSQAEAVPGVARPAL